MSRDRYRKNKPNDHLNCITEERLSAHDKAVKNLKKCKEREASKITQIIVVDKKTVYIKEIGDKKVKPVKSKKTV